MSRNYVELKKEISQQLNHKWQEFFLEDITGLSEEEQTIVLEGCDGCLENLADDEDFCSVCDSWTPGLTEGELCPNCGA